jgi:hypothetical protein
VLLDGIQVDGTYFQSGQGTPSTLSTSRVLPVAAGTHTFNVQASAGMLSCVRSPAVWPPFMPSP